MPTLVFRARIVLTCLSVAAVVLTSALADARTYEIPGIQGADDRRPVIEGGPSAGKDYPWPWRAIGRVNRRTGGFCTGTLIAPDLVLTAAHCLEDRRLGPLPPDTLHFVAGYRFGDYDAHSLVAAIHRPDRDGPRGDFALLRLREPMDIRPMTLSENVGMGRSAGVHARVWLAGYSQDRPHLLAVDRSCVILGVQGDALWRHDCDGPKGSSGGPVLVSADGTDEPLVAGISIGFTERLDMPRGVMIPAPVIRAFVQERKLLPEN
ncbi:trypsin-like serine peptidase [Rhodospira trueperi]|uniref:Protease YdgD n=1 Tax=Rhodospira trueperi TaxID=69960 RepID=A0A1G7G1P2_9PROT|nr:trypsin-like serine protease [Rhodospira trueperi]SDE82041.1 protease YdgD [Rhodospira trueperi]